jgi:asparagine synthase (glutamine-hydrolysing)
MVLPRHPVVQAAPGAPLGSNATRQRPVARIGGWLGVPDPDATRALGRALGPEAQLLDGDGARETAAPAPGPALVCDWDSCWVDGAPVRDLAHWRAIVDAGRLATVHGAFALAWLRADGALCLARDAVGERTLFYARVGRGLVFASTLRALLATGLVPRALYLPAGRALPDLRLRAGPRDARGGRLRAAPGRDRNTPAGRSQPRPVLVSPQG